MKIIHQGFVVTQMVGHMSATITENPDNGGYVEVVLTDDQASRSYDLNGLTTLTEDLRQVLVLAEKVESVNKNRGGIDA